MWRPPWRTNPTRMAWSRSVRRGVIAIVIKDFPRALMIREPTQRRFTLDQCDEGREWFTWFSSCRSRWPNQARRSLAGQIRTGAAASAFRAPNHKQAFQLHSVKPSTCGWTLTAVIGDVLEFLIPKPCAEKHARFRETILRPELSGGQMLDRYWRSGSCSQRKPRINKVKLSAFPETGSPINWSGGSVRWRLPPVLGYRKVC